MNWLLRGILYRVQGKGTFVSPAKRFKEFHRLLSFTEEAAETGLKVKNVITAFYTAPPDVALCSIMNTTPQNTITHVNRVRMVNNEPLAYEESCFATSIIGDIDESTLESPEISGSIYRYLEQKKKVKIAYGHQNLSAVSADNKLSIMLAVPEGTPLLKMTLTGHTSDDRVFEYAHTYYRCDKYTFSQTSYRDKH